MYVCTVRMPPNTAWPLTRWKRFRSMAPFSTTHFQLAKMNLAQNIPGSNIATAMREDDCVANR